MYDSKLISIYLSLNIDEKRKLRKWINSEFVNKNDDVLSLFEFIDSRKSINAKTTTKEKAHAFLYPNKPFNDLRMRHLIWMTTDILELFVIQIGFEKEDVLKDAFLSKFYLNKGLHIYANKTLENAIDKVKNKPIKNIEHYKDLYDLGFSFYDLNSRNNRTEDFNINESLHSFTILTIVEVLKTACAINTIQKVMENETKHYLLQPILDLLSNNDNVFMELPIVRIYYHAYLCVANEDENAFQLFLEDIKNNEALFSIHELNRLYRTAINFCVKKLNQNDKYYTQKTFDIYMYTIENGILIDNNEINRFAFTNTITLGIKLDELNKLETFINTYSHFIHTDFRQNTIDYNTAKILHARKQHHKALTMLLTNEFKDTIWNLNAKFIIAKIYFELDDITSFSQYLKSFKVYIKRKSNIGYHKTYFSNVTDALTKLLDVYKKPEKNKGFTFDSKTPDVDWFNKMLDELKTKKSSERIRS